MSRDVISHFEDRSFAHEVLNHIHVILGNLELLEEERPGERLLTDAREAAQELSGLFRRASGR